MGIEVWKSSLKGVASDRVAEDELVCTYRLRQMHPVVTGAGCGSRLQGCMVNVGSRG